MPPGLDRVKVAFLESESASTVKSFVRGMVEHARADTLSLSADKEQGEMEDGTIVTSLDWSADEGSAPGNLSFVPQVKQDGCEEESFGAGKERADDKPTSGTTRQSVHTHTRLPVQPRLIKRYPDCR